MKSDIISSKSLASDHKLLIKWYNANKRNLPWRQNKDPYRIWLSEVMLQQTTVVAVIPYFERFLLRFPNIQSLAAAEVHEVEEAWAGLGYYSRARNLHKAAIELSKIDFPKTWQELIQLPGFGPYTSRAVSSIAFQEKVGVIDGNVIRVLTRYLGLKWKWWEPQWRDKLQEISDRFAELGEADSVNQGLMELGATVCTPQSPTCMMCPWLKSCKAHQEDLIEKLPLKKVRRKPEVWIWHVDLVQNRQKELGLVVNDYLPFLKGKPVFPGRIYQSEKKPTQFDLKHSITHHNIYVLIQKGKVSTKKKYQWSSAENLKKLNPSSALQKILRVADKKGHV
ncbi:MAG: A/G-specific adenine glycosylase [Bdellovibrionia bacterium]